MDEVTPEDDSDFGRQFKEIERLEKEKEIKFFRCIGEAKVTKKESMIVK
jgi:hypothetical protein